MDNKIPMPLNEFERIVSLSEFDLDYTNPGDHFKDLSRLAAKVAGADISLVNLIDTYTQWTIGSHGIEVDQVPREDTVCQYTIAADDQFEVGDLSADERFSDKYYVTGEPNLKYYFGVPLKTGNGKNIGALCVVDTQSRKLAPEKIELLKIIASEIVNRLKALKKIASLESSVNEISERQKRVVHDIRGPLAGIIGLTEIIAELGGDNNIEEVLEFVNMIHKSSNSILDLANEILHADMDNCPAKLKADELNQLALKDKLEKLFSPQARNKHIELTINTNPDTESLPFAKSKLLQIAGNLISNAIKFTPVGGKVSVTLGLKIGTRLNNLYIGVRDSGVGIDALTVNRILNGEICSTIGTSGEQGHGYGLSLVKQLVDSLHGEMMISSEIGQGTLFEIHLPQSKG